MAGRGFARRLRTVDTPLGERVVTSSYKFTGSVITAGDGYRHQPVWAHDGSEALVVLSSPTQLRELISQGGDNLHEAIHASSHLRMIGRAFSSRRVTSVEGSVPSSGGN